MQKKVLMVAYTNYSTDARVIKEAEALVNRGMRVDFICLKEDVNVVGNSMNDVNLYCVPHRRYRGNKKYLYIYSYLVFFVYALLYSTYLAIQKRYKLVHVNNMPDFLVFATIVPKLLGAKIVLDIHDPLPLTFVTKFHFSKKSYLYRILLWQERMSVKFSDRVITVHSLLKDEVLANDGIAGDKIDIISNFADEKQFNYIKNFSVNGNLRIVYHGTIAERFGLDNILSELKGLDEINYDFTIIGTGDYSEKIKIQIEKYNLSKNVHFNNRSYPVDELPEILAGFNLGVVSYKKSPATDYMLPVKLFELISLGIPSIVVKNRAISHYFSADDVFFYNSSESGSLIQLIKSISENKNILFEKRNKLIEIREKYFWSSEAKKYYEIVQKLVGEN